MSQAEPQSGSPVTGVNVYPAKWLTDLLTS